MKSRLPRRQDFECANSKQQSQALTILIVGTMIFGGALFQVDVSIDSLISDTQGAARAQIMAVLITGLIYIWLMSNVSDVLAQTTPLERRNLTNKLVNPLFFEVLFAIGVFVSGTLVEQPFPQPC